MTSDPYKRMHRDQLERWILKLILAEHDIGAALETAQLLDTRLKKVVRPDDRDVEALFESMIVSYGRPFSGTSRLPQRWPGYTQPQLQQGHEKVMAMRHQFVGHSDPAVRRVTIAVDPEHGFRYSFNVAFYNPTLLWYVKEMTRDLGPRLKAEIAQAIEALLDRAGLDAADGPVAITVSRTEDAARPTRRP